jgi:hypothetical protein
MTTYFLLVFDRSAGQLVEAIREFRDANEAVRARIDREATARAAGQDLEVVVLGAASRAALERTHSRYFGSVRELSASA